MVPKSDLAFLRGGCGKYYFSVIGSLPEVGSVVGDDDQLGLTLAEGLQSLLVAQAVLAGFHDQSQTSVDALQSLFLWNETGRKPMLVPRGISNGK